MATLFKNIILILLPLIVMLAVYLAFDPFEVVFRYKTHYNDPRMPYNWDYNQVETLVNDYSSRRYDSFIFGSSRSMAFLTKDWLPYITLSRPFHFAAANESIYGVHRKMLFLSKEKMPIRNALVVLDSQLLSQVNNSSGFLYLKHPKLSGESSLTFHLTFFRSFIEVPFLIGYLDYKLTGKVRPLFKDKFNEGVSYDRITGDKFLPEKEKAIEETPEAYYNKLRSVFYPRDFSKQEYSQEVLGSIQVGYLRDIRKVFDENRTDYRIIISPNYDLKRLSPVDIKEIHEIFGRDRVYDYSGINRFTRDMHNYYENSHFRTRVGKEILREIYTGGVDSSQGR